MKTPSWEKGEQGSIGTYPPKNKKMLLPNSPVTPGMHVTAQCKGEIISLRIAKETKQGIFKATIIGSYFLNSPDILNNGDEVSIGRDFILWLHEKE